MSAMIQSTGATCTGPSCGQCLPRDQMKTAVGALAGLSELCGCIGANRASSNSHFVRKRHWTTWMHERGSDPDYGQGRNARFESKKTILASAAHEQVPAMSLLCARSTGPEQRVSARPVEQHCPSAAGGCQRVGHSP